MASIAKKIISTALAPRPVAPYNQAIVVGNIVYTSGMLGMDRTTNQLVSGGISAEAKAALENLKNVLEASGSKVENVIKCTVLLNNINDFGAVNEEYKKIFTKDFPARTCFQAGKLPLGANVEIEAIAIVGDAKIEHVNVS